MSDQHPFQELETLAEEELGHIAAGRIDDVLDVHRRRDELIARLPELVLDPTDREALARAHAMQVQITALLERATAEMSARLNHLDRGRASVRAYANSLKQA